MMKELKNGTNGEEIKDVPSKDKAVLRSNPEMITKIKKSTREIGMEYESFAVQFLRNQGIKIICRNFITCAGEIDLIGLDKKTLVFIEVRYRKHTNYGTPAQSIDYRKQQRLCKSAAFFLRKYTKYRTAPCRFDVIAITLSQDAPVVHWIPNAFLSLLTI